MASTSLQFGPDQLKCKEYYSYVTGARKGDNVRISPCPFSVTELICFSFRLLLPAYTYVLRVRQTIADGHGLILQPNLHCDSTKHAASVSCLTPKNRNIIILYLIFSLHLRSRYLNLND